MSRQTVITCDFCGQTGKMPAESWRNLDVCPGCAESSRPVGEVLALIRGVVDADGTYVSADDIIPARVRPRREK